MLNSTSTDLGELWREVSETKFIVIGKSGRKEKVLGKRIDMEYMRVTGILRQHRYCWRRGTRLMGRR